MPISHKVKGFIDRSSFIRAMFETGMKLKAQYGAENVYDFSLGNPDMSPPSNFIDVMRDLLDEEKPGIHGYMSNSGFPEVRAQVAEYLSGEQKKSFTGSDLIVTCGAGGALNVVLKAILDPGDTVVVPKPYFVEYDFYADNHGGSITRVPTGDDFQLPVEAIGEAITEKTRALIINSPNNPTGVVYPAETLDALFRVVAEKSKAFGRPIFVISDEPYRKIVYDGITVPPVFGEYPYVIMISSYSKDLSLAGERIGFAAVHPDMPEKALVMDGLILANRILGFVNAPAIMQRAIARLQGVCVDVAVYQRRRDMLVNGLREIGYELIKPQGAFYLFPKTPIPDDVAFVAELQKENVLAVPGSGFQGPGHMRISYTVPDDTIERSLPGFRRAFERCS